VTALAHRDGRLETWHGAASRLLPEGAPVWDGLQAKLATAGHAGAVVVTNQDPDGYRAANDRVLGEAAESEGRLVPFFRIDPREGRSALAEVGRSLDAGHRGMKLHPRAEDFRMNDAIVRAACEEAASAGVPVLVHAGRGIPSLGRDAARLCDQVDGLRLILAHAAISDLSWLGPTVLDHPGLYFDTAWWDITDLLALFAWVPPGRIIYASDTPYGHPQLGFVLTMRAAASAGYEPDHLKAVFGGTLQRLLDGREGAGLGPAPGIEFVSGDPGLMRVHASLHGAIANAFSGHDPREAMALARLGCEVPPGVPHEDVYRSIAGLLDSIRPGDERRSRVVRPLIVAAAAALTPEVPVP
jgi:hypothetical protein